MILPMLLLLALIFVNGWTDAPNAIATCVGCGAMKMRSASLMAAVMNLLGTVLAFFVSGEIAMSMMNVVSFGGEQGEAILCAAMLTVVIWAVAAWGFGLPTSESHALVSALSGSALAVSAGVSISEWQKVIVGLLLSVALGSTAGCVFGIVGKQIHLGEKQTKKAVRTASALMALAHGAQDGQKFVGVFLLMLGKCETGTKLLSITAVAVMMSLGTLLGGERIVNTVAREMTTLEPKTAFCADLGGAACVLVSTFIGIPISTTHSKTTAVMGVASVGGNLNFGSVKKMILAWTLTFPACFALGYLLIGIFE